MSSNSSSSRTATLLERIDKATETLVTKFSEIIELSETASKEKSVTATDPLKIAVSSADMTKASEDLLFVTRSLKEAWILGQLRPIGDNSQLDVGTIPDELLDKIV